MTPAKSAPQNNDLPKLAAPARRALDAAGYTSLAQLTQVTEAELKKLHGIGPNAITQLRLALEARGLAFAPDRSRSSGG